jgi:sugar phosphate isomerase/epimerase
MFSRHLPPFVPPRTAVEDRKALTEALAEVGEHAAREGVWLAIEPLNRYEDYMVNRLEQAVSLAEEVERGLGTAAVGVCADLFHMNIEEDDLAKAIASAGRRLVHVHVDDSNRLQPGTGHLDFAAVMDALHAMGYDGWLTLECRLRGDPPEALPATARFLAPYMQR